MATLPVLSRAGAEGQKMGDAFDAAYAALQERGRLQKAIEDFEPIKLEGQAGYGFLDGTYAKGLDLIRAIYSSVEALARYYMRNVDDSGSPWTPIGNYAIDSLVFHKKSDNTEEPIQFPWPNGWTRKWPKSICTFSQPGEGRVRFEVFGPLNNPSIYLPYYICSITDPFYGTYARTPDSERENSGKFFRRVDGAWILDSDQYSPPEIMVEQVSKDKARTWIPQSGEYFGEHNLNDLREAILQCRKIPIVSEAFNFSGFPTYRRSATGIITNSFLGSYGEDKARIGSGLIAPGHPADDRIPAEVQLAYSGQTQYANGGWIGMWSTTANYGTTFGPNDYVYTLQAYKDQIEYGLPSAIGAGLFTSLQCKNELYIVAVKYPGGYDLNLFDDFGLGLTEDDWTKVGEKTGPFYSQNDGDPSPLVFGWVDATPPTFPPLPPKREVYVRGWIASFAVLVFDFTGEFEYN